MTDNGAVLEGYTEEVHGSSDECDLYLLVKPNTDLDSRFKAWDMDGQEFIVVNGWLFQTETWLQMHGTEREVGHELTAMANTV